MPRFATAMLAALFLAMGMGATVAEAAEETATYNHTDRLIVRFRHAATPGREFAASVGAERRSAITTHLQALTAESIVPLRTMGDGAEIIKLNRRLSLHQVRQIAASLAMHPDVLEVIPDRLFFPQLTPTDPQYASQWYLTQASGINLPTAWDLTTGSANLVIAILDTGSLPHTELASRWIGGYDFVSLAERSNDGNVRDANPADPGDWVTVAESASGPLAGCPVTDSRWHGTAMAGVIGAAANNATGIAGINWNSKLLPVRVVGKCGGYESDIIDGLRWAAGIAVSGVPANANPAKVANLSLASVGACSSLLQSAIDDVNAAGTTIVVAAGNNSASAGGYSPGNCGGVITVGAVDKNGGKPNYANFGSAVSLAAPGGIGTLTSDAILTTFNAGTTTPNANNDFYATANGTSIAAAQVSGIASLVLSLNPTLSPQYVKEILVNTARTFPTNTTALGSQADCTTALCGSGIVEARKATLAAQAWGNTQPRIDGGGIYTSIALATDGTLYGWGLGSLLGNGGPGLPEPVQALTSLSGITRVSTHDGHTLAVRADGTVWAWGQNGFGQLGDGTSTQRTLPVRVTGALLGVTATEVAAGYWHSLALGADGLVRAWGDNQFGQLGDGTNTPRLEPGLVPGLSGVTAIAAGSMAATALKSNGTVVMWGDGDPVPTVIAGLSGVVAIATDGGHRLFLKGDGTVWAMGANNRGQLGDGTTNDSTTVPVQVSGLTGVTRIAAGYYYFSLAIKSDGTLWAWGGNEYGQLGDGTTTDRSLPARVLGISGVYAIGTGLGHALAIKPDGSVYAWGFGANGILGTGVGNQLFPIQVPGPGGSGTLYLGVIDPANFAPHTDVPLSSTRTSNAINVTGIGGSAAISVSGGQYSIGCTATFVSTAGTIANGQSVCVRQTASASCNTTTTSTLTIAGFPVKTFNVTTLACDTTPSAFSFVPQGNVATGATVTSNTVTIAGINAAAPISIIGGTYSIGCTVSFIATAGTIANSQTVCVRQIASASNNVLNTATLTIGGVSASFHAMTVPAAGFAVAARIDGGLDHSLGVRTDGSLFGWGVAFYLGNGGVMNPAPVQGVTTLSGVSRLSAFYRHVLALRSDGSVWSWGDNFLGELGNGNIVASGTPLKVGGPLTGLTMSDVAAGYLHSLALQSTGVVWAWGFNGSGQLGDGTMTSRLLPTAVMGLSGVTAIAAGESHSLALTSDGNVWRWGAGTGSSPAQVAGIGSVAAVAAGANFQFFLKSDGTVWTASIFGAPSQVSGLSGITRIAAGHSHSLALKSDGTVWAWGLNETGQLGDGTTINRGTPVAVQGLSSVVAIGAGSLHSLAIKADGSAWAWGKNEAMQLGTATPALQNQPAQIPGPGGSGTLFLGVADPASFAPQTDVPLSSTRTSNAITVTGVGGSAAISVSGGQYSVGCTATFVSTAGTIANNQTVCVRQTAAAVCNTTTTTTLTIAGFPVKTFNVTTLACDIAPDVFGFVPQGNVALGATLTSNSVTITGISASAPISVSGGTYSIGCTASFTAVAGSIANNQTVCVRQVSGAGNNVLTTATLTIGSASAPFHVMTVPAAGFMATPQAAGGDGIAYGLRSDGTLFGWPPGIYLGNADAAAPQPVQALTTLSGITRVAVSHQHTLALRADGSVWAWGNNFYGQLGNGNTNASTYPLRVGGALAGATMTAIATSDDYSLALKSDGSVWVLGSAQSLTPVMVADISNVTAIAAGQTYSMALKSDGTVWQWGAYSSASPAPIAGLVNVTAIAGGLTFQLFLKSDGTVWSSSFGASPAQVAGLTGVSAIAGGREHSLALKSDGTVWAWGTNGSGQLGDGTTLNRATPVQVQGLTGITSIGAGFGFSLAVKPDGSVWTWGGLLFGGVLPAQVPGVGGNGFLSLQAIDIYPSPFAFSPAFAVGLNAAVSSNPIVVSGLGAGVMSPVTLVGGEYSINGGAFTTAPGSVVNGTSLVVRGVSAGTFATTTQVTLTIGGAAGQSSTFYLRTRADASTARLVPQVALGDSHSTLRGADGIVYGTGYNGNGQLGNGTTLGTSVLRPVSGLAGTVSVAAGAYHGMALRGDGTLVAWGWNAAGQLGHNSANNSERYLVNVSAISPVAAISAGSFHSVAVKTDGSVWAWGLNVEGQVGDGSAAASRLAPVPVSGLAGVTAIAAGGRHTLALLAGGSVMAWGANDAGQLGDGTTTQRNAPVAVAGLSGVVAIAAGGAHSLAIKSDGTVVAWGFNAFGQLGDGTTANRLQPVAVPSLGTGVGLIAAGANHSLAVKAGGALYTWGANTNSQLGDGGIVNRSTPFNVVNPTNIVAIAGGGRHSAAINNQGKLFLWGDNYFGQVGNKSGNYNPNTATLNVLRGDSEISTVAQAAGSSTGTSSSSGSAVIEINEIATGFDFKTATVATAASPALGKFKNQALTDAITGIGISVNGSGFSLQSTDCALSLNAGTECNFAIGFTPSAAGDAVGELQVASSLIGSPERRSLFGIGLAPMSPGLKVNATAGETYLSFAPQAIGSPSAPADVIITNTGTATLVISSIGLTTGAAHFSVPATCTTTINPGASCTLPVTFNPSQANGIDGQLTIASNAGTQVVTLSGTGVGNGMPVPLTLTGAVSRKVHGGAGSLDVVIDRNKTIGQAITTEPRSIGNGHVIVFTFNLPIAQTGSASATDATPVAIGNIASVSAQGSSVFVTLMGVPDRSRATVTLSNVSSLVNSFPVAIGFMVGDVTNNAAVNAGDIAAIKARVNQGVGASTARYDVNTSGTITAQDVSMVKARAGWVLP